MKEYKAEIRMIVKKSHKDKDTTIIDEAEIIGAVIKPNTHKEQN